jgi:hypothetical protein
MQEQIYGYCSLKHPDFWDVTLVGSLFISGGDLLEPVFMLRFRDLKQSQWETDDRSK